MRVHAVSDIHTDYKENLAWVEALAGAAAAAGRSLKEDVLLLGGDVSDDPTTFERTLQLLVNAFGHVCFTPGNHGAVAWGSPRGSRLGCTPQWRCLTSRLICVLQTCGRGAQSAGSTTPWVRASCCCHCRRLLPSTLAGSTPLLSASLPACFPGMQAS